MNDVERLKVLDPARGHEPTAEEWVRSRAAIDRIVRDAPATRPVWRRRRFAVTVAAVAAAALGIVVVSSVLPGAYGRAVASWTPQPGGRSGEDVLPQARTCAASWDAPEAVPSDVVLAEQRGTATMLIMKRGGGLAECMTVEDDQAFGTQSLTSGPVDQPPGTEATVSTMSSRGSGSSAYSSIVGQVGPDVTGVDVRLRDGRVVQASVASGWWTAWWPGPEGGWPDMTTVVVHTAAGSTSHHPSEIW